MSYSVSTGSPSFHDLVGVGFGPSNLALAIALAEEHGERGLRTVFLERKEEFGWHRGLMLPDATMQVSFLKDLVTLRTPTSRFGFLSYLRERDRLVDFINRGSDFPSRVEFHDYLEWAAAPFADQVRYGAEVLDVRPVRSGGRVTAWDVVSAERRPDGAGTDRAEVVRRTRNVVLATGITPALPEGVERSERVWHSEELLPRVASWPEGAGTRFAVVGAGQSAAETAAHLHQRFPDAQVYAVMSRYGYSPADDSPFANRVFDPSAVDDFYDAPPAVRKRFYDYHANTNYSVVDLELIEELYRRHYEEKVTGRRRLHLVNLSVVEAVKPTSAGVALLLQRPGAPGELEVDVVVFATGYRPMDPAAVLGEAAGHCVFDDAGRVRIRRDYRVVTAPDVDAGVYLQGGTEHTHGLSSSLLSNVAVRSGEIAAAVAAGPVTPSDGCTA
ncbi:lysine N(6)-hydroxylase/L-ornithine N(5)-oxygenase family protein [Streptomyces sp. TP-A0874]|uniref:lysine N(6)-hydroxylase/L-ornithine N(5)-oxygenase family protein n=1 Tax=Streptomyces sp. TP-A0874 TaxID=549819 RepID=UPI000853243F|nr:SidA/IucD/PvdA family monooxygenase [Streptomyces sp. TP-A0874]